jgi:hypothetical protein
MQTLGPTANQAGNTGSDLALFKDFLADPNTAIPLNSNFLIGFRDIPNLIQEFQDEQFRSLEPGVWKVEAIKNSLINIVQSPTSDGSPNYCLFAQGLILPSEALSTSRQGPISVGADQAGGLLSGVVASVREPQTTLDTTFLETNFSFVDFLIRPWIIAISHYGLRERKNGSVKTDMSVIFFDKHQNNKIRKIYTFFQCAPVSFGGITASYGDNTLALPKVNWVYNYYSVAYTT